MKSGRLKEALNEIRALRIKTQDTFNKRYTRETDSSINGAEDKSQESATEINSVNKNKVIGNLEFIRKVNRPQTKPINEGANLGTIDAKALVRDKTADILARNEDIEELVKDAKYWKNEGMREMLQAIEQDIDELDYHSDGDWKGQLKEKLARYKEELK